jgi:hypothetical protein
MKGFSFEQIKKQKTSNATINNNTFFSLDARVIPFDG